MDRPAGQALGDALQDGKIGRSGQQKPPGPAIAVHRDFDGIEDLGAFVGLVYRQGPIGADEPVRIRMENPFPGNPSRTVNRKPLNVC